MAPSPPFALQRFPSLHVSLCSCLFFCQPLKRWYFPGFYVWHIYIFSISHILPGWFLPGLQWSPHWCARNLYFYCRPFPWSPDLCMLLISWISPIQRHGQHCRDLERIPDPGDHFSYGSKVVPDVHMCWGGFPTSFPLVQGFSPSALLTFAPDTSVL